MLHVIATPIGNLGDLSPRALDALRSAQAIACEDTRRTWQLLSHFGVPRPAEMFSYRQGNEERVEERVLGLLRGGAEVALCSDGGYPGVSDPGYRLLRACAREGLAYEVLPGACAVEVALNLSGPEAGSWTCMATPVGGASVAVRIPANPKSLFKDLEWTGFISVGNGPYVWYLDDYEINGK